MTIIIGFIFKREAFKTATLTGLVKNIETNKIKEIILERKSWKHEPDTLFLESSYLLEICELTAKPFHRQVCWVRKKAFRTEILAESELLDLWEKAKIKYKEAREKQIIENLEIKT